MVQQRLCLTCAEPFEVPATSKRRYCSTGCQPLQGTHSRKRREKTPVACANPACGKWHDRPAWEVKRRLAQGWKMYCSVECRDAVKKGRRGVSRSIHVEKTCAECGGTFTVQPHRAERALYCSVSCGNTAKGRLGGGGSLPGPRAPERRITRQGYALIYLPPDERPPYAPTKARHMEHRSVMAKMLGRWPTASESVHHINGDRQDNRPENLQLRSGGHGNGHVLRCRCCGASDIEYVELA